MEHIKLNKLGSNSEEIEFEYKFNGKNYLIIATVEYWTVKQDSYGVADSSWIEVDAESFEFSHCIVSEDGIIISDIKLDIDELKFIEQECINYLNDEYV